MCIRDSLSPTSLNLQHRPWKAFFPNPWRRPQTQARQGLRESRVCRPRPCPRKGGAFAAALRTPREAPGRQ
eukprot:7135796-Alexandrium_andersonii.AAC.1